MCASHWDRNKPKGEMKVRGGAFARLLGGWAASRRGPALPGRLVLVSRRGAPGAYTLGPERW